MSSVRVRVRAVGVVLSVAVSIIVLAAATSGAAADDSFYKGKRLSVLVNFAAGGPTDIEGRLFAKYIGKYIDGQPGVIVQNMDGAGGLSGTSYLGAVAPKDGTVIAAVQRPIPFQTLFGDSAK